MTARAEQHNLRELAGPTPQGARWFQAADWDLFVWQDEQGLGTACQLSWRERERERIYTWSGEAGDSFGGVDGGDFSQAYPRSALIVGTTEAVDYAAWIAGFDSISRDIDAQIRSFVLTRLRHAADVAQSQAERDRRAAVQDQNHAAGARSRSSQAAPSCALITARHLAACVSGELTGLIAGLSMGWPPPGIAVFAAALALAFGFTLVRFSSGQAEPRRGKARGKPGSGEAVSILSIVAALTAVDYWLGGMTAESIDTLPFWRAVVTAAGAAYVAGYAANHSLLKRRTA